MYPNDGLPFKTWWFSPWGIKLPERDIRSFATLNPHAFDLIQERAARAAAQTAAQVGAVMGVLKDDWY